MFSRFTKQLRGIYWPRLLALALTIACAVMYVGNLTLFTIALIMVLITWIYWNRYPTPLSLLIIALTSLAVWPMGLPLVALSTVLLDRSLRLGNDKPWWFYLTPIMTSALIALLLQRPYIALYLAIPGVYIALMTTFSIARFYTVRITLTPDRELSITAGSIINYRLTITTKPRLRALIRITTPRSIKITPNTLRINGETILNASARYRLGGVKRPRIRLTLTDELGLISTTRVVMHPEITVIPRARAALEVARGLLAQASATGGEDVREVREYVPGDPVRRIHWKKSVKVRKLVIKLLEWRGSIGPMLVLTYTTNPEVLDRIGEFMVYTTAEAVTRQSIIELHLLGRDGNLETYSVSRTNYFEIMNKALGKLESLGVELLGGTDAANIFDTIKYAAWLRVKDIPKEALLIVGQGVFVKPLCEAVSNAICISV
jgi:Uncharacterized conserved protein (some members contain a von Willebrand factor type A (vWA) domain)